VETLSRIASVSQRVFRESVRISVNSSPQCSLASLFGPGIDRSPNEIGDSHSELLGYRLLVGSIHALVDTGIDRRTQSQTKGSNRAIVGVEVFVPVGTSVTREENGFDSTPTVICSFKWIEVCGPRSAEGTDGGCSISRNQNGLELLVTRIGCLESAMNWSQWSPVAGVQKRVEMGSLGYRRLTQGIPSFDPDQYRRLTQPIPSSDPGNTVV